MRSDGVDLTFNNFFKFFKTHYVYSFPRLQNSRGIQGQLIALSRTEPTGEKNKNKLCELMEKDKRNRPRPWSTLDLDYLIPPMYPLIPMSPACGVCVIPTRVHMYVMNIFRVKKITRVCIILGGESRSGNCLICGGASCVGARRLAYLLPSSSAWLRYYIHFARKLQLG